MLPSRRPDLPPPEACAAKPIELHAYGDFADWLAAAKGTLAISTYNSGKLALLQAHNRELSASFWQFPRPMGLAAAGSQLAIASQRHIAVYRLEAASISDAPPLTLARAYATGRLDAHDLAFDNRGLLFANTRFNCVGRPSERVNFVRTWQPWFVPQAVRRDCCHLNGVGVREGRLALATAFCESDEPSAWRAGNRFTSGVLIDIRRNVIAVRGLSMPHSPRWHAGQWWFCNSGEGSLCAWDALRNESHTIASLPGFTRGLTFAGGRAVVGLSRIRRRHVLDAPPVRDRWPRLQAGAAIVDAHTGEHTGGVEFRQGGREVYEVAYLPSCDAAPSAVA